MATIVLSAHAVIEAAQKTIRNIEDERLKRDEEKIAAMMGTKRGWFKKFYPSREIAIKILDASDMWGWRSVYAWGDLDKAKALLHLAKHGDPVTLDQEDVRVIF